MMRTAILAAACAASLPLALGAWQAQQAPVFRSAIELVHLDVSVLDRGRQPVRGLTADDFTVLEDGRSQPIVAFSAVDADAAEELSAGWMRQLPFDVQSNSMAEDGQGRLFVLLIDDAMLPSDPGVLAAARSVARKFIDRLSPADRVAVVFSAAGRSQDFTNDRSRLRQAIDSLSAGYAMHLRGWDTAADPRESEDVAAFFLKGPQMDTDAQWRRASLATLKLVAETLIAAPQRRKAMVFISPGIAVDHASAAMPMQPHILATASMKEANRDLARELPEIYRRMQHANVTIYPVDPFGGGFEGWVLTAASRVPALRVMDAAAPPPPSIDYLDPSTGFVPAPDMLAKHMSSLSLDFLQNSAANTGGFAVVNTNDFDDALDRMFRENNAYYLIGYPATTGHAPGSLRRISVRVNRPDVMVRARSGYTTPEANEVDPKRPPPSPLDLAIEGPVPKGGFPMRIAVAPVAVPGKGDAAVTLALALEQAAVTRRTESLIDLQINAYMPEGKPVLVGRRHSARVVLVPAGSREPARYELLTRIDLKPGRYQLRLSAHRAADATSGSVFADVEVPDFARDPLTASGAIVEVMPPMRSAPAGAFDAFLPVVPTTLRDFDSDDGAVVFLRLYQGGKAPMMPVRVQARVLDATDTTVATEEQVLRPDRFYLPGRAADYRFAVPLTELKPGKYAAMFEITAGGRSLTRGIRFTVR